MNIAGNRIGLKRFLHALTDGERLQIRHRHLGEARKCGDYAVRQRHVPFNSGEMLGLFCRRRILGVEKIIDGGFHDIQRIAQFVGDAARDLANGRQALAALPLARCSA